MLLNYCEETGYGNLEGKDRQAIAVIFERMRLEVFFPAAEAVCFKQGHSILVIRKTLTGKWMFSVPVLWGTSHVVKVWEEEVLAVIWERIVFDDKKLTYIMKTVFDEQKSVTSFYYYQNEKVLVEALKIALGESVKIAKHLNIPLVDRHNLGIVPVLFMPNLPNKNWFGTVVGEWYPNNTPLYKSYDEITEHIQMILDNISWELESNRTLVFMGMSPLEQEEIRTNSFRKKLKEKWNRFIIQNQGMGNNYLPYNLDGAWNAPVDNMQGKPNLEVLANYYNFTVDRAFIWSGYNSPQGTREHAWD